MKPVEPTIHNGARRVLFGTGQDDYIPLPASVDFEGTVMTEWVLTAEECARLTCGGHLRLWLLYTGVQQGRPLTPVKLDALLPDDNVMEES